MLQFLDLGADLRAGGRFGGDALLSRRRDFRSPASRRVPRAACWVLPTALVRA
jgi:hypothetical protein